MKNFYQKILKNILSQIFLAVFFLTLLGATKESYAVDCSDITQCGSGRIRSCSASGSPSALGWSPVESSDIQFDLSNPVCLTVIATSYALVKAAIAAMNVGCGLGLTISATPSPIADAAAIAKGTIKAASNAECRPYLLEATASFAAAFVELMIIYGISINVFNNTALCGAGLPSTSLSGWNTVTPDQYNIRTPDYKASVEAQVKEYLKTNPTNPLSVKYYREWYYGGVEFDDNPSDGDYCQDPTGTNVKDGNGNFPRQKYYMRGTDSGNFNCKQYDLSISNSAINPNATVADYNSAYSCCKNRSQNYVCIDYHAEKGTIGQTYAGGVFCKSESRCTINGITFSAAPIDDGDSRMICAQTYSLCPYNFTIGKGGTKYCDYFQDGVDGKIITPEEIAEATDPENGTNNCNTKSEIRNADCTFNSKADKCKNYCQYLTHCVKIGASDYQYQSNLDSPYFSSACFNFIGDSRNQTSYGTSASIIGSQRHFSAPIAQCIKETLENVFYNKAGHSQCATSTETAYSNGICASGNYLQSGNFIYKTGNQVKDVSFFSGLQNTLQGAVRMLLSLAIIFYGMKILIGNAEIKKPDILMFLLKIGLVMYFATGDAWQGYFFEGVYNASSVFSEMVFDIDSSLEVSKKDGCQFDDTSISSNPYPDDKDYLSLWDTLDCKITRYLGYGPEVSVANICMLILASIFTGPFGVYFAMALMFFGFFFISMTIRALHIFLSSAMAIILMVYISPIIIPMVMFPKTKDIFQKWLTNLIGFCLQPMILFAYIAIFIIVFDSTMIGSATFVGQPPNKAISCDKVCKDDNNNTVATGDTNCTQTGHAWSGGVCKNAAGNTVYDDPTCSASGNSVVGATCRDSLGNNVGGDPDCSLSGHTMVDPLTDSVACLIGVENYSSYPGLANIGISIPILFDLFTKNVKDKILTLVKAALVMYVLCEFMDQIPSITGQLIGGSALGSNGMSAAAMMKKVGGGLLAIEQRAVRGSGKYGKDSANTIRDANIGEAARLGKSAADHDDSSGGNTDGNSGGG